MPFSLQDTELRISHFRGPEVAPENLPLHVGSLILHALSLGDQMHGE